MRAGKIAHRTIFFFLLGLASCGSSREVVAPLPAPPPAVAAASSGTASPAPAPSLPAAEPTAKTPAVLSEEEVQRKADQLLKRVEALSAQAQNKLKNEQLPQAKVDFETALDLILSSGIDLRNHRQLKKNFDEVFNFLYQLEAQMPAENGTAEAQIAEKGQAVGNEGKEETDQEVNGEQALEPAAIDELEELNLFPITIEPDLRARVVEDIANTHYDIPVVVNEEVLRWLEYFKTKGRRIVELGLRRIGLYRDMIHSVLAEAGLPKDLIYLAQQESMFKPLALSRSRARGMWQFIAGTGKLYGLRQDIWVDEKLDPEKSTRAAARHIQKLYQMFGDWYLTMAAYNAGEGRIQRIIEKTGLTNFWDLADRKLLRQQTATYVPSILAFMIIGKHPEKYDFSIEPLEPIQTQKVTVPSPVDLSAVAVSLGMPLQRIQELNPELRRKVTPPNQKTYQLNVHLEITAEQAEKLASLPLAKKTLMVLETQGHHKVQPGDSLWTIARHHGVSVDALKEANHLTSNRLKIGQQLTIPGRPEKAAPARMAAKTEKSKEPAKAAATAPSSSATPSSAASNGTKTLVHQVRRGDSLYIIARRYKTTIQSVREWNNLNTDSLHPGDTLLIYLP